MIKRNLVFLLSILLLLNLILCVDIITAAQNYVPRNIDIDRSDIPKNILVGSFIGGRSHIKPMLDVTAILVERGYNVRIFFFKKKFSVISNFFKYVSFFISILESRHIGNFINVRKLYTIIRISYCQTNFIRT